MAIEHACTRAVSKPWGGVDLRPWSKMRDSGDSIGELWFQRPDAKAPAPALLLKLLFTTEPLSIQVHPDDAFAQSIGLEHGKTEAWYVLAATPDAKIAIGLKRRMTTAELRTSIENGSISNLVQWRSVHKDEVIFIPAGLIHAIGPGLVIAEIQQRSEATFRLFDHGRQRELHVDEAVAAANAGPADSQPDQRRLTDVRTLLVASPYFVLERIDLAPRSNWELDAERETWVLVLKGCAKIGLTTASVGEAFFLEEDRAIIEVGAEGVTCLLAYLATEPSPSLLLNVDRLSAGVASRNHSALSSFHPATTGSRAHSTEARH
ncbi:class I mannose-6-phosphate isomerase [Methylocapsa acidiphila]|uniref:class I mannose-6-phosphate isomerase n=1 Tax=Methylocapsa acidiphila TaxID=133552 RepID=UPI000405560F|nr:class I mannose-6-phosphate isomerase [Methylocapsa acidiphila]